MRAAILAVMAACASSSVSAAEPLWQRYPHMLCRGERGASCDSAELKCRTQETNAVWSIDFPSNLVTYFGNDYTEQIIATNQSTYRDTVLSEYAVLKSGRVMVFRQAKKTEFGTVVEATLVGSSFTGQADITAFECAPRK